MIYTLLPEVLVPFLLHLLTNTILRSLITGNQTNAVRRKYGYENQRNGVFQLQNI
jgi:hypothetical protein